MKINDNTAIILMQEILRTLETISETLQDMKLQEHDYWETWKKAKIGEIS